MTEFFLPAFQWMEVNLPGGTYLRESTFGFSFLLTAHVVVDTECFLDGHAPQMLDAVQACLVGHFDVEHSTIQLEPAGHADHEHPTHA